MDSTLAKQILEKTRGDYDVIADAWNITRTALKSDTMELFASLVRDGSSILDVGCGNGRLLDLLVHRSVQYTGVDVSARLVDIARLRYPSMHHQFVVGDILALPFPDSSFDAIAAISVLHHIPSAAFRQQAVAECYRVLKPGGLCFVTNWNQFQPSLIFKHKTWKAILGIHEEGYDEHDLFIPWKKDVEKPVMRYIHVFRKRAIDALLREVGFSSIDVYYSYRGKRAHWWNGRNLVAIAKK